MNGRSALAFFHVYSVVAKMSKDSICGSEVVASVHLVTFCAAGALQGGCWAETVDRKSVKKLAAKVASNDGIVWPSMARLEKRVAVNQ